MIFFHFKVNLLPMKWVNIDRTTVDDLINILTEHKDDQPGADKLSDDDFRDYFKKLQSRK